MLLLFLFIPLRNRIKIICLWLLDWDHIEVSCQGFDNIPVYCLIYILIYIAKSWFFLWSFYDLFISETVMIMKHGTADCQLSWSVSFARRNFYLEMKYIVKINSNDFSLEGKYKFPSFNTQSFICLYQNIPGGVYNLYVFLISIL